MKFPGDRITTDPLAKAQQDGPAAAAHRASADQLTADNLRDYMLIKERNRRYAGYFLSLARKPSGVDAEDARTAMTVLIEVAFDNITDGIDPAEDSELQDLRSRLSDGLHLTGHTTEQITPAATAKSIGGTGLIGKDVLLETAVPVGRPWEQE